MTDSEARSSQPRRKKHHRFLFLVIGILLGVALSYYFPRYAGPYLENITSPDAALEGEVTDKVSESGRLVLKVSTEDGVLLASFVERRSDVDMLVDAGDTIALEADRYRPFLEEPAILSVDKPGTGPSVAGDRRAYVDKLEAQLAVWEEDMARLEERAAEVGEDLRQEYDDQLVELREKRDVARRELDALAKTSGSAWSDVRDGVEDAWSELQEALDRAKSRFEEPAHSPAVEEEPDPPPEPEA
jgi:hypothetical protein